MWFRVCNHKCTLKVDEILQFYHLVLSSTRNQIRGHRVDDNEGRRRNPAFHGGIPEVQQHQWQQQRESEDDESYS